MWQPKTVGQDKMSKVLNKAVVPVPVQIQGEKAVRRHHDQIKVRESILFFYGLLRKSRRRRKIAGWANRCGTASVAKTLMLKH